jgi:arylsulfatase A-like enzyme
MPVRTLLRGAVRSKLCSFGLWTVAVFASAALGGCSAEPDSRSVILITIDTLRADHLSIGGNAVMTSPSLDAFARRGTRFDWALSTCSYTVPSHASMLVGMYPSFHSAGLMNSQQRLAPEENTLAEILREAGWRTAAIVSNAVLHPAVGLNQGFESYDARLPDRELVRNMSERRAAHAVDRALEKLDEFGDQPFFMWLHLQDPHGPYTPPSTSPELEFSKDHPIARQGSMLPIGSDNSGYRAIPVYQAYGSERGFDEYRKRYDREIHSLDSELKRLLAYFDEHALLKRTLVIVTADHGEAMGEDDFYFAHGHSVGLEQVHVPLFFTGDDVRADQSISTPVSNMSVFATILEYLGQPVAEQIQSQSLLSTLTEGDAVSSGPFFTESFTQRGIVDAGFYLRADRRPASDEKFWRRSPISGGFITPLGTSMLKLGPTLATQTVPSAQLGKKLRVFSRTAEEVRSSFQLRAQRSELDQDMIEELRALGYSR